MTKVNWISCVMAGLAAATIQIDTSIALNVMTVLVAKGFIGGFTGAYFGNHISSRRMKKSG